MTSFHNRLGINLARGLVPKIDITHMALAVGQGQGQGVFAILENHFKLYGKQFALKRSKPSVLTACNDSP